MIPKGYSKLMKPLILDLILKMLHPRYNFSWHILISLISSQCQLNNNFLKLYQLTLAINRSELVQAPLLNSKQFMKEALNIRVCGI